jgi:hypothetical protein
MDQIESKLNNSLGLKIPQPLKRIRIRGDKAYISGHGPQNSDGSIAGPFGKVATKNDVSIEQAHI